MRTNIKTEFLEKHQSWSDTEAILANMRLQGLEDSPEYRTLKEQAQNDYKDALRILRTAGLSAKQNADTIFLLQPAGKTNSLLNRYLLNLLTPAEETVMFATWRLGEKVTAVDLKNSAAGPIAVSTITSILDDLVRKGFLLQNELTYSVNVTEARYRHDLLQRLVANYFNGSFKELGTFLIECREFTHDHLDRGYPG